MYQSIAVTVACLVASEVVTATQCQLSETFRVASKVIRVIGSISIVITLIQLIIIHVHLRAQLSGKKALRKLMAVKILAIIVITQTVVFGFIKPNIATRWPHASFFDILVGVPNFLTCIEMALFAVAWMFLFGVSAVQNAVNLNNRSPVSALIHILNISDIVVNVFAALTTKIDCNVMRDNATPREDMEQNHEKY